MPSLAPKTSVLGYSNAAHLLKRTTFGVTKSLIDAYALKTPQQALDDLFVFSAPNPTRPLDNDGNTYYGNYSEPTFASSTTGSNGITGLETYWWLYQALKSPTIQYKLVVWLHVLFVVDDSGVGWRFYDYLELLRYHTDKSLKDLAVRVSRDCKMLYYLDNKFNNKLNPNQNYAREFLELFTILKGPQIGNGNYTTYTEQDVQAAARVLTGFTTSTLTDDRTTRLNNLDPVTQIPRGIINVNNHDTDPKVFSSAFNNTIIQGGTDEASIQQELVHFVDMVFAQTETAKNYCRRLYRFFVSRTITNEIETDIITPLATSLINNNYQIVPVLKQLLCSLHFYDEEDAEYGDEIIGAMVKSPIDLYLQMYSIFEITFPNYTVNPRSINLFMNPTIWFPASSAALPLFRPLDVNGYSGYKDAPQFDKNWITTGTLKIRYSFTIGTLLAGITHNGHTYQLKTHEFVRYSGHFSAPANADVLLQEFYNLLFAATPQADRYLYFRTSFLGNLSTINWQNEWNNYLATENFQSVKIALDGLVIKMILSPEFQLM